MDSIVNEKSLIRKKLDPKFSRSGFASLADLSCLRPDIVKHFVVLRLLLLLLQDLGGHHGLHLVRVVVLALCTHNYALTEFFRRYDSRIYYL